MLPGKSNYFIGNNSAHWISGIPQYGRVAFSSIYSGIDAVYYGNEGQLEYELNHLRDKLRRRDRGRFLELADVRIAQPHPLFLRVRGGVEPWEERGQKR